MQVGTSEPGACALGSDFFVLGPGRQRPWSRVSLQEAEGLQKPRGPPVWNRLSEPHVQPRAPRQSHRGIRRHLTGNPNEKQTSGLRQWLLTLFPPELLSCLASLSLFSLCPVSSLPLALGVPCRPVSHFAQRQVLLSQAGLEVGMEGGEQRQSERRPTLPVSRN